MSDDIDMNGCPASTFGAHIAAGLILFGLVASLHRDLVAPRHRAKMWIGISVALLVVALFSDRFAQLLGNLGTIVIALIAIWSDRVIDFFNPPSIRIHEPVRDPTEQQPTLNLRPRETPATGYLQYHITIENCNSSRPLREVTVSFRNYQLNDRVLHVAVPRQFTWAPHESEPSAVHVMNSKTLDFCYIDPIGKTISLIIYSGNRRYEGGEAEFNHMQGSHLVLELEIAAANMTTTITKSLGIDLSESTPRFRVAEAEPI
jgi:hypothetical protein